MTVYIGVDFHARQQTISYLTTEDGEIRGLELDHGEVAAVRGFYEQFAGQQVVVGFESREIRRVGVRPANLQFSRREHSGAIENRRIAGLTPFMTPFSSCLFFISAANCEWPMLLIKRVRDYDGSCDRRQPGQFRRFSGRRMTRWRKRRGWCVTIPTRRWARPTSVCK